MNELNEEIVRIFDSEIAPLCDQAFKTIVRQIKIDIKHAEIKNTGGLMDSVWSDKADITGNLTMELKMGIRGYGRFKDMKNITYDNFKPAPDGEFVRGIKDWIERGGIRRKKKYIPGYYTDVKRRVVIPESRANNRLAYTIALSIVKYNRNNVRTRFWNKNRGKVYASIKNMIYERLPEETLHVLMAYYEDIERIKKQYP